MTSDAGAPGVSDAAGAPGGSADAGDAGASDGADHAAPRGAGRRQKLILLALIGLASVATLAGATQPWLSLKLAAGAAAMTELDATGQQLNASLSSLALAGLAAALALTIAGPWLRRLLGVLVALLGAGIVAIAVAVQQDPWGAAAGTLGEVTGVVGEAQRGLVEQISVTPMILAVLVAGGVLAVLGVLVLSVGGRWSAAGRKYETAARARVRRASAGPDRIAEWDELSGGADPTGVPEDALREDRSEEGSDDEPRDGSPDAPRTR